MRIQPQDQSEVYRKNVPHFYIFVQSLNLIRRHWLSPGVALHVCEAGNDNILFKCTNVPGNGSNATFLTLTPGSDITVMIYGNYFV